MSIDWEDGYAARFGRWTRMCRACVTAIRRYIAVLLLLVLRESRTVRVDLETLWVIAREWLLSSAEHTISSCLGSPS